MIVINGENLIVGRAATFAAKKALLGETINIVNCEKMYLTGSKEYLFKEGKRRRDQGTWSKGPIYFRMPDRFVRRIIRGMLPHKTARGKDAFARVMCYVGVPEKYKNEKMITLDNASIKNIPNLRYLSVEELTKHLGAK